MLGESFWFFLGLGLGLGTAVVVYEEYNGRRISHIACICYSVLVCIGIWFLLDIAFTSLLNFIHDYLRWF